MDLHTGKPLRLYWGKKIAGLALGLLPVQTYRDVLMRHVTHPEAKAAGPDGLPCGLATKGELSRLRVRIEGAIHVGKESHELEEVQAGLTTPQSAYVHYADEKGEWRFTMRRLKETPIDALVERSGLSRSQIYRILAGECHPRNQARILLSRVL